VDARSIVLLESNFITLLAVFKLELCRDSVMEKVSAEILGIFEAYHALPCKCPPCLANLRSKIRIWDNETIALYALFEAKARPVPPGQDTEAADGISTVNV